MPANNLPNSPFRFPTGFLLGSILTFLLTVFTLSSTGALAFTPSDVIDTAVEVKRNTLDRAARAFWLWVIPQGHNWGVDADLLDGFHAASFALQKDFTSFQAETTKKITDLTQTVGTIDFSPYLRREEQAADSAKLAGELPSFFQNASNLISGTLADARLSGNAALLNLSQTFTAPKTFSNGLTVSGGTLTLPSGSITTDFLANSSVTSAKIADSTIVGADLAGNISISTTGNLATTGSGTITSAGLLTASNAFTLSSGALTLPSASIADSYLSSNVAFLSGTQTFTGAKTFSALLTASGGLTLGGNFLFSTDNAFDIGASGATRPRNIYPGTGIVFPDGSSQTSASSGTDLTNPPSTSENRWRWQWSDTNVVIGTEATTGTGSIGGGVSTRDYRTGSTSGGTASASRTIWPAHGGSGHEFKDFQRGEVAFGSAGAGASAMREYAYFTNESVNTEPSNTAEHIGIRITNDVFFFSTADGTTEQTTDITSFISGFKNTRNQFVFTFDETSAKCYVNGVLRATHTTNIPTSTALAGVVFRVFAVNTSAADAVLQLYWAYAHGKLP